MTDVLIYKVKSKKLLEDYEDVEYIPRIGEKILIGSRHNSFIVKDILYDIELDEVKILVK